MYLKFTALLSLLALGLVVTSRAADLPPTDERFKADLLLVVAHPDDETVIASYLARAMQEQHKRVAVVFGTRGSEGGNAHGQEQASAMALIRENEARRALAHLGVNNVWFLGGIDTPGQDVLRSLERWRHGTALDELTRIVRLTRPEVMVSWLPLVAAGENHGDHQAAAVIATEAFDLSGNPVAFAEQVTAPRDANGLSNELEGLHPWQPQKLYFYSDATDITFLNSAGPRYDPGAYARVAAEETSEHETQGDSGKMAKELLARNSKTYGYVSDSVQFVLGKSLVGGTAREDVFAHVQPSIPFHLASGYRAPAVAANAVKVELGGPWFFYRSFWQAHDLAGLPALERSEILVNYENPLTVPVRIANASNGEADVHLSVSIPPDWIYWRKPPVSVHLGPGDTTEVSFQIRSPAAGKAKSQYDLTVKADPGNEIRLRLAVGRNGMPQ